MPASGDDRYRQARRELARRVEARRRQLGLTQQALAGNLGHRGPGYVHGLEATLRNPGVVMLVRLARALEMDPGDLIRGLGTPLDGSFSQPRSAPTGSVKAVEVELGKRVRARRDELGLTQERFAELAGVHRTYVHRIEAGVDLSLRKLLGVCDALDTDPGDLLRGL